MGAMNPMNPMMAGSQNFNMNAMNGMQSQGQTPMRNNNFGGTDPFSNLNSLGGTNQSKRR